MCCEYETLDYNTIHYSTVLVYCGNTLSYVMVCYLRRSQSGVKLMLKFDQKEKYSHN